MLWEVGNDPRRQLPLPAVIAKHRPQRFLQKDRKISRHLICSQENLQWSELQHSHAFHSYQLTPSLLPQRSDKRGESWPDPHRMRKRTHATARASDTIRATAAWVFDMLVFSIPHVLARTVWALTLASRSTRAADMHREFSFVAQLFLPPCVCGAGLRYLRKLQRRYLVCRGRTLPSHRESPNLRLLHASFLPASRFRFPRAGLLIFAEVLPKP